MQHGIHHKDCVKGMRELPDACAQIVLCDPPYNIGKDFGNDSDRQEFEKYIDWCKEWVSEAFRVLKPDGTMYIYGFSEILAHIQVRALPKDAQVRWLIWHYTNKNVPSNKFWQRSHESVLCVWKAGVRMPHFNLDDVREPYTETFLKNAAGKTRKATKGRFSSGTETTTYQAHEKGALPRDVIKVPALAGGAGKKERVDHPTQKPLEICRKLILASQKPNGLVVIPFAGSGSECVACDQLKMPFIAYEVNEDYVVLARERLANKSTGGAEVEDA
jgi:site-specific DNA-methyltransferase (adenine-specific)